MADRTDKGTRTLTEQFLKLLPLHWAMSAKGNMAKKYLAKFKIFTTIALDYDSRKKATFVLNKHYLGREHLKPKEKVSKEHEDSHWNKEKHSKVTIQVGLRPDGYFDIIKVL